MTSIIVNCVLPMTIFKLNWCLFEYFRKVQTSTNHWQLLERWYLLLQNRWVILTVVFNLWKGNKFKVTKLFFLERFQFVNQMKGQVHSNLIVTALFAYMNCFLKIFSHLRRRKGNQILFHSEIRFWHGFWEKI